MFKDTKQQQTEERKKKQKQSELRIVDNFTRDAKQTDKLVKILKKKTPAQ